MSYVDGFVIPVRSSDRQAYKDMAAKAALVFKDHGALRIVECWGEDVPKGKLTDFYGAVKTEADETVVFSWIEWPSKAVRDSGNEKVMKDPRMQHDCMALFDGKRLIYGGFDVLVDTD